MKMLCRLMGVSCSGFYGYLRRRERVPDGDRQERVEWTRKLAMGADHTYGTRRIAKGLSALGYPTGRHQARGLMREAGVQARYRRRYRVTTNSRHRQPVHPNRLAREFQVSAPNRVWVGDITYVWTQEGWLYLAVVIDLFSRKVVGWSMGRRLKASLACDALQMGLWSRRPAKEGQLIHHSDRGVQYASRSFRQLLETNNIKGSMSRKGDCWDNAVVESFFGSLKSERIHWRHYQSREVARADIVEYITMFYNPRRLHSYLGYQSPDEFEKNGRLANMA